MPTRKQRRRRSKDFRHDVRVFEVDEEGNEVPIADLRAREEKPKAAAQTKGKQTQPSRTKSGRPIREVSPPSWERAFKRGGLMGAGMLIVFVFVLRSGAIAQRVGIGVFYVGPFMAVLPDMRAALATRKLSRGWRPTQPSNVSRLSMTMMTVSILSLSFSLRLLPDLQTRLWRPRLIT